MRRSARNRFGSPAVEVSAYASGSSDLRNSLSIRRLSGAQEVAVVSGTGGAGAGAVVGGDVVFCGGGTPDWDDNSGNQYAGGLAGQLYSTLPVWYKRSMSHTRNACPAYIKVTIKKLST